MSLHLATVDITNRNFTDYVRWLKTQKSKSVFSFEKVLKYANFPSLSAPPYRHLPPSIGARVTDHREIEDIFQWLKGKEVNTVLDLSVGDRLYGPHSDEAVAYCVNNFQVKCLKWKRLDLYMGYIEKTNNLTELHLYSSGSRAVHDHWYQQLPLFRKVRSRYPQLQKNNEVTGLLSLASLRLHLRYKGELGHVIRLDDGKCWSRC